MLALTFLSGLVGASADAPQLLVGDARWGQLEELLIFDDLKLKRGDLCQEGTTVLGECEDGLVCFTFGDELPQDQGTGKFELAHRCIEPDPMLGMLTFGGLCKDGDRVVGECMDGLACVSFGDESALPPHNKVGRC